MVEGNVRVLLASESPRVRHVLRQVIEREDGVEVVAQAQDVPRALVLAANLRPDVAVIDCLLPYSVGLDTVPLSRINGLDAAQAILWQMPDTGVVLLNNLDTIDSYGGTFRPDVAAYSIVNAGAGISIGAQDRRLAQPNLPVFASVSVKPPAVLQRREAVADKCVIFGVLAFAGGWLLILTIVFAPVGAGVALMGLAAMGFGLAARLAGSFWRGIRGGTKEALTTEGATLHLNSRSGKSTGGRR